jgi:hypothetical protein
MATWRTSASIFLTLDVLRRPTQRPANICTGILVFVCALHHKKVYNKEVYTRWWPRYQKLQQEMDQERQNRVALKPILFQAEEFCEGESWVRRVRLAVVIVKDWVIGGRVVQYERDGQQ